MLLLCQSIKTLHYTLYTGIESAQHNAAYILSRRHCPPLLQPSPSFRARPFSLLTPYNTSHPFTSATTATTISATTTASVTVTSPTAPPQLEEEEEEGRSETQSALVPITTTTTPTSVPTPSLPLSTIRRQQCELRSLYLYTTSARQGHAESYLRVGDAHYYGLGGLPVDRFEAANYYQVCACHILCLCV